MVFFNIISIHQCVGGVTERQQDGTVVLPGIQDAGAEEEYDTALANKNKQNKTQKDFYNKFRDICNCMNLPSRPTYREDGTYYTPSPPTDARGETLAKMYQERLLNPLTELFTKIGYSEKQARLIVSYYDKCRTPKEQEKFTKDIDVFFNMTDPAWVDEYQVFMKTLPQPATFSSNLSVSQLKDEFTYWQDTFTKLINNLDDFKAPRRPADGKYSPILINGRKPLDTEFERLASTLPSDKKEEAKYVHYVLSPLRQFLQGMGLNEVIAGKAVDTFDIEYRTGERREKFISLLYGIWHRFKKNYALYEIKVEIDNIVQSPSVGMVKEAEQVYQNTLHQGYNPFEASLARKRCIETHVTEKYFEAKEETQRIGEPNINHLTTIEPRQIIASPLKFYDLLANSHHPCISLVTPRASYGSKACNEKIVRLIISI